MPQTKTTKLSKERILEDMNEAKKERNIRGYIAVGCVFLFGLFWSYDPLPSLVLLVAGVYEYYKYKKWDKEYKKWKEKL